MDVKFIKALIAYSFSFTIGYLQFKSILKERYLKDLALEYSPNYLPEAEVSMK